MTEDCKNEEAQEVLPLITKEVYAELLKDISSEDLAALSSMATVAEAFAAIRIHDILKSVPAEKDRLTVLRKKINNVTAAFGRFQNEWIDRIYNKSRRASLFTLQFNYEPETEAK